MGKAAVDFNDDKSRERIFLDIVGHLLRYNDAEKKHIADEAGISWQCIYQWTHGKTISPQIRTLAAVARVLGYDIVLKRQVAKIPKLRRVK